MGALPYDPAKAFQEFLYRQAKLEQRVREVGIVRTVEEAVEESRLRSLRRNNQAQTRATTKREEQ